MLTELILESAVVLAEELERRKAYLVPNVDTPVEELVAAAEPVTDKVPEEPEAIVQSLEEMTSSPVEVTPETHDNILEGITTTVSGLLNRRLHLAKDVVNPLIAKYTDLISKYIEGYVPQTAEVTEVDFGEFYNHPLARNIFEGYGIKDLEPVQGFKGIVLDETNNYYKGALKTGSGFIDKKLEEIINERGEDWYLDVVRKHFTNGQELVIVKPEVTNDYREEADKNLVIHMVARHLYDRNETLNSEPVKEQELKLLRILGRTSQNINNLFKLQDDLTAKEVVVPVRASNEGITVYGPNYRKFLDKGGNNSILAGYVKVKGPALGIEGLLEKKVSLESAYDQEVSGEIRRLRLESIRLMRLGATQELGKIVKDIPVEVLNTIPELQAENINVEAALMQRGREYIQSTPVTSVEDIYSYASNIITLGLLPELELHMFYNTMDKYLKPSGNGVTLTPAQAAYYACLEEVTKYFLSQVSLLSTNK